jgi:signal transduction histidine kinase
LATGLASGVSAVLLYLGWLLAGQVVSAVPLLPPGTTVRVGTVDVEAAALGHALREQAQAEVLRVGTVAFVCVVAATAVLAWVLTGRVLRPLSEVTATARRLSAESMSQRLRLTGPKDEVTELADTFDAMLDRLQTAFESQRRFVANASHELRTPLSVVLTELDVTLSDPDADEAELRRMAAVVRDATLREQRLVEALLELARTESAEPTRREPTDLAAVAASAWRGVAAESRRRGLAARFDTPSTPVIGDSTLLERIAGNLLENAVRHNVDGGWITVTTAPGPAWSALRVSSSGLPVAEDRVGELFEPFRRGGIDRTSRTGTGLGLSIVRAAVLAHRGHVGAVPVDGGGLTVTVELPAAP